MRFMGRKIGWFVWGIKHPFNWVIYLGKKSRVWLMNQECEICVENKREIVISFFVRSSGRHIKCSIPKKELKAITEEEAKIQIVKAQIENE